jgi:phosphopantetheine adenylyltransferase/dephospho-CoA kinase
MEASALLEAGWDEWVDEVWVVACDEVVAIQRLCERNKLTIEQAVCFVRAWFSARVVDI